MALKVSLYAYRNEYPVTSVACMRKQSENLGNHDERLSFSGRARMYAISSRSSVEDFLVSLELPLKETQG